MARRVRVVPDRAQYRFLCTTLIRFRRLVPPAGEGKITGVSEFLP